MDELFIKSVLIDWDKVQRRSYLRQIEAIRDLERLTFTKPITVFVGENGSGKSTMLEALAISCGFNPEGGSKNYRFSTYDSHSELCEAMRITKSPQDLRGNAALALPLHIFSVRKASIMWRQKRWITRIFFIPPRGIMRSLMGRDSCILRRINCGRTDCIFLTSRRRRCRLRDSSLS